MQPTGAGSIFPTTRWTLILAAKTSPEARHEALTHLMTAYWRPLYVFFRHKGLREAEAQDAVQEVMALVLEREAIDRASPEKGRLRAYLRTIASHWLISRHEREAAFKRGGARAPLSLDDDNGVAERLVSLDAVSPEAAYERAWAHTLMQRALSTLEAEYRGSERSGPFAVIALFFGGGPTPSYKETATTHHMTVPQLKSFLHRARGRYRALVRAQILDTVGGALEADAELASLTQVLSL